MQKWFGVFSFIKTTTLIDILVGDCRHQASWDPSLLCSGLISSLGRIFNKTDFYQQCLLLSLIIMLLEYWCLCVNVELLDLSILFHNNLHNMKSLESSMYMPHWLSVITDWTKALYIGAPPSGDQSLSQICLGFLMWFMQAHFHFQRNPWIELSHHPRQWQSLSVSFEKGTHTGLSLRCVFSLVSPCFIGLIGLLFPIILTEKEMSW